MRCEFFRLALTSTHHLPDLRLAPIDWLHPPNSCQVKRLMERAKVKRLMERAKVKRQNPKESLYKIEFGRQKERLVIKT